MQVPTIKELNEWPQAKLQLLLHRIMHTSDMVFQYHLYQRATLLDLAAVTKDLLMEAGTEELSNEERSELVEAFQDYDLVEDF